MRSRIRLFVYALETLKNFDSRKRMKRVGNVKKLIRRNILGDHKYLRKIRACIISRKSNFKKIFFRLIQQARKLPAKKSKIGPFGKKSAFVNPDSERRRITDKRFAV